MQLLFKIRDTVEKATEIVAIVFFAIGILSTIYGTFSRTITFLPSISWSAELTRFSIISAVLLVAGIGIRRGMQVSFTLVLEKLPPSFRLGLHMINNAIIITFFIVIGFFGFDMAITNTGQHSPILQIPMIIPYLFIPISSLLVVIEVIFLAFEQVLELKNTKKTT
ncbi:TRAP transporter small permease [Bacillus litorisediminis]|uniref:TRAP transporter small permease n=1 Tax=Bacillus litorisediminis TaxID=2922713 RepID=UPI001FACB6DC|nr:TRAP transporter small permease subunit [Bacillus litorisediminis]